MVKVSVDGRKVISVPVASPASPVWRSGASATPWVKLISKIPPLRRIFSFSQTDSALTTDTPTPCKPPDTL